MKNHWNYLKYVTRHKYYVWWAGRNHFSKHLSHWQLLKHDLSKFRPSEWFPYVNTFYKRNGESQYNPSDSFDVAWLKHINRNPHHYQHWILQYDSGEMKVLEMPEKYVYEMIADWMGAGLAINGGDKYTVIARTREWYVKNYDTKVLHPNTRKLVDELLLGGLSRSNWASVYNKRDELLNSEEINEVQKAVYKISRKRYSRITRYL